jgi:preprotein translocase subunit YajC
MLFINEAMAATTTGGASTQQSSGMSAILMLVVFVVLIYFLIWRPQSKRAKDQKQLINSLGVGDEVVTSGGIVGKITKVDDHFMELNIAEGVTIKVQRGAVTQALPKGTSSAVITDSDKKKT